MPDDEVLSASSASDEQEWLDGDDLDDGEVETVSVVSLLDDRVFPDAMSMISYCKEKGNLDFLGIRDRLGLDFHGTVKLINFIRQRVHDGAPVPEEIASSDLEDDRYLKPVLDDDALILCLDDLPEPPAAAPAAGVGAAATGQSSADSGGLPQDLIRRNAELHAELEALAKQFSNYRLAVQQTLDRRWGDDEQGDDDAAAAATGKATAGDAVVKDDSAHYWESYAQNEIHETMLKDRVRTDAYRDFIYGNKHLFKDKVVLDVGCGTGILSMFCAKAGAKQVIAVDKSEIVDKARENIFNNGLSDQIVCLKGRIEEVILPVKEVDIIVSEWMGYCLLYEAMLPSIIWARDRYLRPDGLLVPSHASIWVAPISDSEYVADNVAFWRDVYGFDMKAMQEGIYADVRIQTMSQSTLGGTPCAFRFLDLHTTKTEDLVFDAEWKTKTLPDADSLDGFLLWFDIFFASSRNDDTISTNMSAKEWSAAGAERVSFTTGAHGQPTHWMQGILLNDEDHTQSLQPGAEQEIHGHISFQIAEDNARGLKIGVTWETPGQKKQAQSWLLQ